MSDINSSAEGGGIDLKTCDQDDRMGFIKKVYVILFAQLLLTAGITWVAITSVGMAEWMQDNWWLYILLIFPLIGTQICLICNRKMARKVPVNYIALLVFTLCETYFVAFLCQYYTYEPYRNEFNEQGYRDVGVAAAMTCGIVAAVTAYAWTTKTDFTMKWGFIWVFGMTFMMLTFFSIFFYSYIFEMILCSLGVLLFGIYLIFDTQLIVGKGRYKLSIDDYILGAMVLYADIIMIFIYLL